VGVHLASIIIGLDVDQTLVNKPDYLHVVLSFHELDALERTRRNETRSTPRFRAPGDRLAFGTADSGVRIGRSPKTKVYSNPVRIMNQKNRNQHILTVKAIDEGGLATRCRAFSGSIAPVVTSLNATRTVVGIDLVRLEDESWGSAVFPCAV
jgi:hypothetical protein